MALSRMTRKVHKSYFFLAYPLAFILIVFWKPIATNVRVICYESTTQTTVPPTPPAPGVPVVTKSLNNNNDDDDDDQFLKTVTVLYEPVSETVADFSIFRKRFLKWDALNVDITETIGADRPASTDKYFIYRCGGGIPGEECGGWTDRSRGMMLAYLIANITGRVFKAEMYDPPCDLTQYMEPTQYDWTLRHSFHTNLTNVPKDVRIIVKYNDVKFVKTIQDRNFIKTFDDKPVKYIYFKANNHYLHRLKNTTVHTTELAWMKNLSFSQVYKTVYQRLFKLSPRLRSRMDDFIHKNLPTARHRLICAHIRIGFALVGDRPFVKKSQLPNIWSFLSQHSKTDFDKIFIMSDMDDTIEAARSQPFGGRVIDTGGLSLHIDLATNYTATQRCGAVEKVHFDTHVMMQCDVLLVSASGICIHAALIRGLDQGLYCIGRTSGIISPCRVDDVLRIHNKAV